MLFIECGLFWNSSSRLHSSQLKLAAAATPQSCGGVGCQERPFSFLRTSICCGPLAPGAGLESLQEKWQKYLGLVGFFSMSGANMLVEEEVEKGKLRQIIECPTLENGKCSCLVLCFSLCKLRFPRLQSHLPQHLFSCMDKPLAYYRSSTPHTLLLASRRGAGEGVPRRMLLWLQVFRCGGLPSSTRLGRGEPLQQLGGGFWKQVQTLDPYRESLSGENHKGIRAH